MSEEEKEGNSIYVVPELLEEIFLALPLKSIIKFKTVSKQWRSILESKTFLSRRKNRRKILAAYNCNCGKRPSIISESRFEGDDEEIVYDLHCDTTQPPRTCDGLVCITEPDWFNVLNPSTGQLRRFPPGLDPVKGLHANWLVGFGRDKVTGRYYIARMCFENCMECVILDVETGEWSKLMIPPHTINLGCKSVYVNGSIYWLEITRPYLMLDLDLHIKRFHEVDYPDTLVTQETELVNLDDRLAVARTTKVGPEWILEIWSMDYLEVNRWLRYYSWSKAYSISLAHRVVSWPWHERWFTPVSVSKQGNLVFYDNKKRLFKYYSGTDEIRCLSSDTYVISSYTENLVSFPLKPSHRDTTGELDSNIKTIRCSLSPRRGSWIARIFKNNEIGILDILFTSVLVIQLSQILQIS